MSDRILLVEDEPDDVEMLRHAFASEGFPYPVDVAVDGVDALDYLRNRGAHSGRRGRRAPLLVLLDIKMPRLDGLGVLAQLREDPATRHLLVIVMTGSCEETDRLTAERLGATLFMEKPRSREGFARAVAKMRELVSAL